VRFQIGGSSLHSTISLVVISPLSAKEKGDSPREKAATPTPRRRSGETCYLMNPWKPGEFRAGASAAASAPRSATPGRISPPYPLAASLLRDHAVPDKLYFSKGNGCCTTAMRLRMISQYSGSRSMPITEKPSCTAASRVVPEPAKGSRTVPPGGVARRHK